MIQTISSCGSLTRSKGDEHPIQSSNENDTGDDLSQVPKIRLRNQSEYDCS